jgi:hypothetical protein
MLLEDIVDKVIESKDTHANKNLLEAIDLIHDSCMHVISEDEIGDLFSLSLRVDRACLGIDKHFKEKKQ